MKWNDLTHWNRSKRSRRPTRDVVGAADAPDLTERIMDRLGYVRIDAAQARRGRRRRMFGRGLTVCALLAVAALGVHLHSRSDRARTPVEQPIHSAVSSDLESVIEGMQRIEDAPWRTYLSPQRGAAVGLPAQTAEEHPIEDPLRRAMQGEPQQSRVPWSGLL